MIHVLSRVVRHTGTGESVSEFKRRIVTAVSNMSMPRWAIGVSPCAEIAPGRLDHGNAYLWCEGRPELPNDICFLVAFSNDRIGDSTFTVSENELFYAPSFVGLPERTPRNRANAAAA